MTTPGAPRSRAATFWALFPVALILANLAGFAVMAYIATDDPGFAVEKDYYRKAVAWDEVQAQASENTRLGWKVSLELHPRGRQLELVAEVVDAHGQRVPNATLEVDAFANARAAQIVSAHFARQTDGSLLGALPLVQPGLWEFRFTAEAEGQRFTEVLRKDVGAGGPT